MNKTDILIFEDGSHTTFNIYNQDHLKEYWKSKERELGTPKVYSIPGFLEKTKEEQRQIIKLLSLNV